MLETSNRGISNIHPQTLRQMLIVAPQMHVSWKAGVNMQSGKSLL